MPLFRNKGIKAELTIVSFFKIMKNLSFQEKISLVFIRKQDLIIGICKGLRLV
jgi:hypothetical protein